MRKTLTAATILIGALAALPAMAQTTWSNSNLVLQGATTNGCSISRISATHNGSALSEMQVTLRNRGTQAVRLEGTSQLAGTGQSKGGSVRSVFIPAGGQATTGAGYPFGGSLAGTRLTITITSCRVSTS